MSQKDIQNAVKWGQYASSTAEQAQKTAKTALDTSAAAAENSRKAEKMATAVADVCSTEIVNLEKKVDNALNTDLQRLDAHLDRLKMK